MNYKTFNINISTTPRPWGSREEQCIKDIIDTLVIDTVTGAAAPAVGHHHNKLYNTGNNRILEADSQRLGVGCTPNANWDTGAQTLIELKGNTDNAALAMIDNHLHIFDAVLRKTDDKYYRTNATDKPKIFSTSNDGFWTYVGPSGVIGTEYLYNADTSCVNAFLDNGSYFNTRRGDFRFRISSVESINAFYVDGATGNIAIGGTPFYRLDVQEPGIPGGGAVAPVIRILCTDDVQRTNPQTNAAYLMAQAGNGKTAIAVYASYDDTLGLSGTIEVSGAGTPDFKIKIAGTTALSISTGADTTIHKKLTVTTPSRYAEMYMYNNVTACEIDDANIYHAVFNSFGNNDGTLAPVIDTAAFTYKAGVKYSITAFANYNPPTNTQTKVTIGAGHALLAGEPITITGTTNYNGTYLVLAAGLTATEFVITKAFVADDATGNTRRPATLKCLNAGKYAVAFNISGIAANNNDVFKWELNKDATPLDNVIARSIWASGANNYRSAGASGLVSMTANQYLWLSVKNYLGTGDVTFNSANVNIFKLV